MARWSSARYGDHTVYTLASPGFSASIAHRRGAKLYYWYVGRNNRQIKSGTTKSLGLAKTRVTKTIQAVR